jgi:hypothetical protein
MSRLMFRELAVMFCTVGGTAAGYSAGHGCEPSVQLILAFLGLACAGGFAEFCLKK